MIQFDGRWLCNIKQSLTRIFDQVVLVSKLQEGLSPFTPTGVQIIAQYQHHPANRWI